MQDINPNSTTDTLITYADIAKLLSPDIGAVAIRPHWISDLSSVFPSLFSIEKMQKEAAELSDRFYIPEPGTLESNYRCQCLPLQPSNIWTATAKTLARILNEQLIPQLRAIHDIAEEDFEIDDIEFDDLYLTEYPFILMQNELPEQNRLLGVGPHRDTNCKGIVAAIVIQGTLPFYVCKEKDLSGSISLSVKTEEILLMRADKFGSLPRPLHYVGKIDSEQDSVIQFGLRQYIKKPQF